MKQVFLFAGLASLLAFFIFSNNKKEETKDTRPNIVIILADDLGFSDAGCFGGEIHTPNIDYLAKNGIRFMQFYNTSRCCPTRASLLTGLYNHDAGIGEMTDEHSEPGYRGYITENTVTLAEVLQNAGYQTAMTGKWHVSNTDVLPTKEEQLAWLNHQAYHPTFSPLAQYPANRGFQHYYGTIWGVVDYFDPFSLVNGTTPVTKVPKNYYHTDALNDTAAAYIKQMSKNGKPFFLYVAENAPHWPLMALPEDIDIYKDTYKVGWDAIREARYKKQKQMKLLDPADESLSPRWKSDLAWEENPDKEWDARAMAVHAAMIDRMDRGIGRIIHALRESGQLDNTLIVFLSDNGASGEVCANYGTGFDRPSETRDGREIVYNTKKQVLPGPETTYSSIGPRWANVANTPYRFWKAESYEGGIHTPMIAFWPKGITAPKGSLSDQVGHVMDFMNTCIELAGASYPKQYHGHTILPATGISLVPSFKGEKTAGHITLFNEHFGGKYARQNNWKLVRGNGDTAWHLYNLEKDKTETNDVSGRYPEKVQELDALWQNWAKENQVFPKPGR